MGRQLLGVSRRLRASGLAGEVDPRVWLRRWTVHVKAIGTGEHAALYLSRYIYRVALTNQRIERFHDGRVTFRYTHGPTGGTRRLTLPVAAFIARFLQHVLPRGFTRVRSYGLPSPGRRVQLETRPTSPRAARSRCRCDANG